MDLHVLLQFSDFFGHSGDFEFYLRLLSKSMFYCLDMFGHSGAFAFFRCPLESWDCSCSFFSHCRVFLLFLCCIFCLNLQLFDHFVIFVSLDFLEGFVILDFG